MKAKIEFECAQNDLMKFCAGTTDYICEVNTDTYPLTAVFVPNPQRSIFDVDENGEIGELVISVGLDTSVKTTLKFEMDAALLKKAYQERGEARIPLLSRIQRRSGRSPLSGNHRR